MRIARKGFISALNELIILFGPKVEGELNRRTVTIGIHGFAANFQRAEEGINWVGNKLWR